MIPSGLELSPLNDLKFRLKGWLLQPGRLRPRLAAAEIILCASHLKKRLLPSGGQSVAATRPRAQGANLRNHGVKPDEALTILETPGKENTANAASLVNYVPWNAPPSVDSRADVQIFAFYRDIRADLAQTSRSPLDYWNHVSRRKPAAVSQRLPLLPDQLGYYEPGSAKSIAAQVQLAQTYGISGLCVEYVPVANYTKSPSALESVLTCEGSEIQAFASIDVSEFNRPFKYCPGLQRQVLAKVLGHERYLRIHDRPVMAFRGSLAPLAVKLKVASIIQTVFQVCKKDPLILWIGDSGDEGTQPRIDIQISDFAPFLRLPDDAGALPPTCISGDRETSNAVYSYPRLIGQYIEAGHPSEKYYWDHVLTGLDESNETGWSRHVVYSSPPIFERWLREAVRRQHVSASSYGKLVIISTWNDWTRTSIVEPNGFFGHGYGLAVRNSVDFAKRLAAGTAILHEALASSGPDMLGEPPEPGNGEVDTGEAKVNRMRAAHKSLHLQIHEVEPDLDELLSAPPKNPVFVYQMGKVGSISIMHGLNAIGETDRNGTATIFKPHGRSVEPVFHLHALADLDTTALDIAAQYPDPKMHLKEIERGRRIRDWMKTATDETRWNVISLTREPVGRNISAFFHDVEQLVPNLVERFEAGDIGPEEIRELFVYLYNQLAHQWFDYHMKPIFGIDVFAHPFDRESGYSIIEEGQTRLLLIRMEDMNRCAPQAVEEFLGIKNFQVKRENTSEEKAYFELIQEFKKLPLPKSFVDDLLDAKFARHFYTPAEIDKLKRKYTGN